MREIQFRAWDGQLKKMHYEPWADEYFCEGTPVNDIFRNPYRDQVYLQYTGLKDKNGKEIYEGDVIDDGVITWVQETCEYCAYKNDGWTTIAQCFQSEYEVIGNIYENPELLTN